MDVWIIVLLSVLYALPIWIKNKSFISYLKTFIILLLSQLLMKYLLAYVKLPDLPEHVRGLTFGGIIVLVAVVITIRTFKKTKSKDDLI
ncbi:hypothetical protein [Paenibacillus sinopodophylli]|uniref:hypothetical protein n=1 Tax=Paenibacillus sinopodophylli TaxID=1837342 RepID=UPI0014866DF3|nr:hypothetical protein [Paenibacillus sinopodophylli]